MFVVYQTWVISMLRRGSRLWRSAAVCQSGELWPTQFCPATAQSSLTPTAAGGRRLTVSPEHKVSIRKCCSSAFTVLFKLFLTTRSNTESHVEIPRNKRRLSGSHAHLLGDSPVEWIPFTYIRGLLDDDQTRPKKQNKTNVKLFSFYLPKWPYFLRINELILIMNIFLLYSFLHTQYVFIPSLISSSVVKSRKNKFGLDWCK